MEEQERSATGHVPAFFLRRLGNVVLCGYVSYISGFGYKEEEKRILEGN